ncbi:LysR family transcriptional regulator [Ochrobactrum sp. MYb379]|uniref:LysR family transcriptional regulator n=1 Tax=Ochrobactrum sp. MYb379 TaxID=2745275 RepID=UPI0030B0CB06
MRISGSDIHLFRVFDSVIRNNGISSAQVELSLSQPTISNHLSALEDRIGLKLCERGRRGFALTEKGRIVHEAICEILNCLDKNSNRLNELRSPLSGRVRIAIVDCLSTDKNFYLPAILAKAAREAPTLEISLEILPPNEIIVRLSNNQLDMGLGGFDLHLNGLKHTMLYNEEHRLYCGAESPLYAMEDHDITTGMCYQLPWVHRKYWSHMRQRSFLFNETDRLIDDIESQLLFIMSGAYIGLLPVHYAQSFVGKELLRPLPVRNDDYQAKIEMVVRAGKQQRNISYVEQLVFQTYAKHLL